ncbi:MAG: hypothetical protein AAFN74_15630 [Myxococcota bacterium]
MSGVALLATMLIGVWLRWTLAGIVVLTLPFAHVRHAHSHLGYFGLLFPLAWLGWRAAGAPILGRKSRWTYSACTVLGCIGFTLNGYGPVAIAASTVVAAFWLISAWPLLARMRTLSDPLGAVPLGTVLSLACVPPIALNLRTHPALAMGFVSTFLCALLFLVILPSTLAGRHIEAPWPLLLLFGGLGALFLGVAPHPVARVGLLAYGGLLVAPILSERLALHVRWAWAVVAGGLGAMAIGVVPNVRPVALGAIHFVILGPVLASLAPVWLRNPPAPWAWWFGHALWGTMSAALVLQAFVPAPWTWTVAALGGTMTLFWWSLVLWSQRESSRPSEVQLSG